MKEVSNALRIGYISKLNGNVILSGSPVPVYGRVVPASLEPPYIYFPSQSQSDASPKDRFMSENTVNIEAVVKSIDGGNFHELESICNQVKQLVCSFDAKDWPQASGFGTVNSWFVDDNEITDWVDGKWVFRKVMRFENTVEQL